MTIPFEDLLSSLFRHVYVKKIKECTENEISATEILNSGCDKRVHTGFMEYIRVVIVLHHFRESAYFYC